MYIIANYTCLLHEISKYTCSLSLLFVLLTKLFIHKKKQFIKDAGFSTADINYHHTTMSLSEFVFFSALYCHKLQLGTTQMDKQSDIHYLKILRPLINTRHY